MRAVQVGGPLGAYFPTTLFDTPFDYEAFTAKGGLVNLTRYFATHLAPSQARLAVLGPFRSRARFERALRT